MIGINVRNTANEKFADWIVDGQKTIETRKCHTLKSFVGKRVAIIRTGEGKAQAIGEVTIASYAWTDSIEWFHRLIDGHKVDESSKFFIDNKGKYLYFLKDAVRYDEPKQIYGFGIVSRQVHD